MRIKALTVKPGGNFSAFRSDRVRSRFLLRWFEILAVMLGVFCVTGADRFVPTEYQLKAAQIYGIAKFVEWPESAFSGPKSPVVIAVLGKDPFGSDLEGVISNKTLNGREIVLKRFARIQDLDLCHILFISTSEENRLTKILETIKGSPVLTVGEMPRFPERGGILYFKKEDLHVRFEINRSAAARASIRMQARLLILADKIHTEPPP